MRPISIVRFERVYAAAILVGVISGLLAVPATTAAATTVVAAPGVPAGAMAMMPTILWSGLVLGTIINLALFHFIARRGSDVALWIYAGLFAIAVVSFARTQTGGSGLVLPPSVRVLAVVQLVLQAIGLWLLFRPDARPWFRERRR